jgi:hypothetical protein
VMARGVTTGSIWPGICMMRGHIGRSAVHYQRKRRSSKMLRIKMMVKPIDFVIINVIYRHNDYIKLSNYHDIRLSETGSN